MHSAPQSDDNAGAPPLYDYACPAQGLIEIGRLAKGDIDNGAQKRRCSAQ